MKKKKNLIIISMLILLIFILAIILFILLRKANDSYRIIKVYETDSGNMVTRETIGQIEAYNNMLLESGDRVDIAKGRMTLKLDDDKYIYADPYTSFELKATGNSSDSQTTINLLEGALANELQNKLSDDSYYEINTPNSTMSVRGTIYYVHTYIGEDGKRYTKVYVFDGAVNTNRISMQGNNMNDNVLVNGGNEIIIYDDGEVVEIETVKAIDYSELPDELIDNLEMIEERTGKDLSLPKDNVIYEENEEKEPVTVTFMYNNKVFGTQTVEWGTLVQKPQLMPAESGEWDYDFSKPVEEDINIKWK